MPKPGDTKKFWLISDSTDTVFEQTMTLNKFHMWEGKIKWCLSIFYPEGYKGLFESEQQALRALISIKEKEIAAQVIVLNKLRDKLLIK